MGLGELHESLFYEHLVKDEDNDSLVVSLDDRIEVVSQYPNLKVRLMSV